MWMDSSRLYYIECIIIIIIKFIFNTKIKIKVKCIVTIIYDKCTDIFEVFAKLQT